MRTAGDLRDLVLHRLSEAPVPRRSLTPGEVWTTVRDVLADQLEVPPEEVTPDADLVRDLGMD